jgi:iron only hydrogenase large subunit-like protein
MPVDSPMIATAKICKKIYPNHKTVFISPCNFKKIEAQNSKYVDYVIDYRELSELLKNKGKSGKKDNKMSSLFDKFYNDYTKVYPLSGGLSKTAHVKNILSPDQTEIIDGMDKVTEFLNNPDDKIRFLDATFCKGGCIGGPCICSKLPLLLRKNKVIGYIRVADKESIPEERKGLVKEAKGISFKTQF